MVLKTRIAKCTGTKCFSLTGQNQQPRTDRSSNGHHTERSRLRHRWRSSRKQKIQSRPSRRTIRRLPARNPTGPTHRLRVTDKSRSHNGLRRHSSNRRPILHGGHRKILRRLLRRRILRQMHTLPSRTPKNTGNLSRIIQGEGKEEDLNCLQVRRLHPRSQPLRTRANSSEPSTNNNTILPPEYNEHVINKKCEAGKCFKTGRGG